MRTLEEGFVSARDTIDLIERPCREWSMARVNFVVGASQGSCPPEELLALAGLPLLSAEWREKLIKRASRA
jgi:MOSC domain-containing protein YiiM